MGIDETVVRSCDHRCIALCLRNVLDTAQLAGSDQGTDLPLGTSGRHRLRDQQWTEWLAYNDHARTDGLLLSVRRAQLGPTRSVRRDPSQQRR